MTLLLDAFQEGDEIRFELEVEKGEIVSKRSRKMSNGLTEFIVRSGQSLLIRAELEKTRERLGVTFAPGRPAKCFCGVPILLKGKAVRAMAATNMERGSSTPWKATRRFASTAISPTPA